MTDAERLADLRLMMSGRTQYPCRRELDDEFLLRMLDAANSAGGEEMRERCATHVQRAGHGNLGYLADELRALPLDPPAETPPGSCPNCGEQAYERCDLPYCPIPKAAETPAQETKP